MPFKSHPVFSCLALVSLAVSCAESQRETPASKQGAGGTGGGGGTTLVTATPSSSSATTSTTSSGTTSSGTGGSAGETSTITSSTSATTGTGGTTSVIENPCGNGGGAAGAAGAGGVPASGDRVFFEDFESGAQRWENSSGTTWAITTDEETSSSVYGNGETVNQPRVASVMNACFTDIVVQADVKVLEFPGSSTTYYAGPCLRVESDDDYYVLGLQGNGNVGLVRVSNGSRSNIQSDSSINVAEGVWYTLRLEVVGDSFLGYVNDQLVIDDSDSTVTFGSIGLCTGNADAVFDNVSASLP